MCNIYEYLSEESKLDVSLSNPFKARAIASAKIKTDKLNAVKRADLLRGGYIAECYVSDICDGIDLPSYAYVEKNDAYVEETSMSSPE